MDAIVMEAYGEPSVLAIRSVPEPADRSGWVIVDVEASALNWHDVLVRRGVYGSPLPLVIGADATGRRSDTGEQVVVLPSLFWGTHNAAPGPRFEILGDFRPGTYAECVSVPEECVFPRPDGFGVHEAAGFALAWVTAYRAIISRGRLATGESLLVLGAGGGVAGAAVSLGAAVGADVVVTSSSQVKIDQARERGARDGVDHFADGWVEAARALTSHGEGFDVVLDYVGRWSEGLAALRKGGRLVTMGASVQDHAEIAIRPYYFGQYELIGSTMGSPTDMAALMRFLGAHEVAPPVVDSVFSLGDAAEAHTYMESGAHFGKIVLTPD